MKSSIFAAAALVAGASVVNAHGKPSSLFTNGADHPDAIRMINSVEPVTDVNSDSMTCGHGSQPASGVAEVTAGSDVEWQLKNGEGGPWIHAKGPVIYSIYQCPGGAASCQPGRDAGWAVIGHNGNDGAGDWEMAKFTRGENVKVKIPSGTPNGEYLIRQELIALHNGYEMYTACAQIKVTGGSDGTLADKGAKLVAYPGAYSASDPGFSFNVYGTDPSTYPWPGPEVFNAQGGGSTTPPPSGGGQTTPPPVKPVDPPVVSPPVVVTPPVVIPPPSTGGSCSGGAIQCDSSSTWSMCSNGAWIFMGPVAAGTSCVGGGIVRRSASRLFRI